MKGYRSRRRCYLRVSGRSPPMTHITRGLVVGLLAASGTMSAGHPNQARSTEKRCKVSSPRVLAVIPARGGSKGLPGKNIRELAGLPLIAHSIHAAGLLPAVTRCLVSTDDESIRQVALEHGGEAPFLRPADLASDTSSSMAVLQHTLAFAEQDSGDRAYDAVLLLEPTSPLRHLELVNRGIEVLLSRPDVVGCVSISEPHFNPLAVGVVHTAGAEIARAFPEYAGTTRRQDVGRFLRINGNFYVWTAEFVRRGNPAWLDAGRHTSVEIPDLLGASIDAL